MNWKHFSHQIFGFNSSSVGGNNCVGVLRGGLRMFGFSSFGTIRENRSVSVRYKKEFFENWLFKSLHQVLWVQLKEENRKRRRLASTTTKSYFSLSLKEGAAPLKLLLAWIIFLTTLLGPNNSVFSANIEGINRSFKPLCIKRSFKPLCIKHPPAFSVLTINFMIVGIFDWKYQTSNSMDIHYECKTKHRKRNWWALNRHYCKWNLPYPNLT